LCGLAGYPASSAGCDDRRYSGSILITSGAEIDSTVAAAGCDEARAVQNLEAFEDAFPS